MRLPIAPKHHLRRPDHHGRQSPILRHHRPRAARRRNELSLCRAFGLQRSRPAFSGDGARGA
jgi:hypothetical protein